MKIFNHPTKKIDCNSDYVLTIGNFDGVHLGHQEILKLIKAKANSKNLKFAVATFIPHPALILRPKNDFLINSYNERRELLKSFGVNYLQEIEFNRDFSTLSPESFMQEYIITNKLKLILLGHDFAFGANKTGNHETMIRICKENSIEVEVLPEFKINGQDISSSIIREGLFAGDIDQVNKDLGRNFYITGRIVKGEGRGKKIGFPTANLDYDLIRAIPKKGVYATDAFYNGMKYSSITNIGTNPTFKDGNKIHIETHLLDFSNDIYGEELKVSFKKRLRDEMKFGSVNELISQIKFDIESLEHLA